VHPIDIIVDPVGHKIDQENRAAHFGSHQLFLFVIKIVT